MPKPLMRIPYTGPLPAPTIIPRYANTPSGAVQALGSFLSAPSSSELRDSTSSNGTVLLTGAGISVASGLADYRGSAGTYTLNKTYRYGIAARDSYANWQAHLLPRVPQQS